MNVVLIGGCGGKYECLLALLCVTKVIGSLFDQCTYQIIDCYVQNIVAHAEIPLNAGQALNIQQMYESRDSNSDAGATGRVRN